MPPKKVGTSGHKRKNSSTEEKSKVPRPPNAYNIYSSGEGKQVGGGHSKQWAAMNENEKLPFYKRQILAKQQFQRQALVIGLSDYKVSIKLDRAKHDAE